MCSRKRQSLFNFQFCLPALSSSDLRLGLLGLQIVCLEQNQRRVARPVQSLVQEEDSFSFVVFCLFFMWNARCQAKTASAFTRRDLAHTNPHGASRLDMKIWRSESWLLNNVGISSVFICRRATYVMYTNEFAIQHCYCTWNVWWQTICTTKNVFDSRHCDWILVTSWYPGRNSCHVIVWLISCVIKSLNIVLYKVSGKRLS